MLYHKFFDLQFMQHFKQDFLPDSFNNMWFPKPIVEMQSSILLSETTTLLMSHLPEHLWLKDNLLLVYPEQPSGYVAVLLATGSVFFICSVELYLQSSYTNCIAA